LEVRAEASPHAKQIAFGVKVVARAFSARYPRSSVHHLQAIFVARQGNAARTGHTPFRKKTLRKSRQMTVKSKSSSSGESPDAIATAQETQDLELKKAELTLRQREAESKGRTMTVLQLGLWGAVFTALGSVAAVTGKIDVREELRA
jgi:hypothetical protein